MAEIGVHHKRDRFSARSLVARLKHLYALGVFVVLLLAYAFWLPLNYSGDDLQYAMVIAQSVAPVHFYHPAGGRAYNPDESVSVAPAMLPANPRYLLEWPTAITTVWLWQWLGWQGDVILPILCLRMIMGAIGAVFLYLATSIICADKRLAALSGIGLGLSVAYWTYSTHLDQSITMVALISIAFYLLVRSAQEGTIATLRGVTPVSGVLALATLYNFTATLTVIAFGIGVALASNQLSWPKRLWCAIRFWLLCGLLCAFAGVVLLLLWVPWHTLSSVAYWRSTSFVGHPEYEVSVLRDAVRGVLGFAKSQVGFPGAGSSLQDFWDGASTAMRGWLSLFYGLCLLVLVLPVVALVIVRRMAFRNQWVLGLLGIWFVVYGLFNWFWDPGFTKYWLVPLLCWWTSVPLALVQVRAVWPRLYRPSLALAVVFMVVSISLNLWSQFLPQSDPKVQPWTQIARTLGAESNTRALFISFAHPIDFYIAYYAHRDIVSAGLVQYGAGGDWQVAQKVVEEHVSQHRAVGGPVYFYSVDALAPEQRQALLQLLGAQQVRTAWSFADLTIYEALPANASR